jgi:hypothetical protein
VRAGLLCTALRTLCLLLPLRNFVLSAVPAATGKSVLSEALAAEQQASLMGADPAYAGGSSSSSSLTMQVLNSDLLKAKQGISGMRFWHQVRQVVVCCCFKLSYN